jgi:hypothetical protein
VNMHTSVDDLVKALGEKRRGRPTGKPISQERLAELVAGGLTHINLDDGPVESSQKLARVIAGKRDIFFNGFAPVRVVAEAGDDLEATELNVPALRTYAHKTCICTKGEGTSMSSVTLPKEVAENYLDGLKGEWGLKPLRGISNAPLVSADGGVHSALGYHEGSGLWCCGLEVTGVPDNPTE